MKTEPNEYVESEKPKDEVERKVIYRDGTDDSDYGMLKCVPKERLLSEDGLKAHRTGQFIGNTIRKRDHDRSALKVKSESTKPEVSEGAESDVNLEFKHEYESEPADLATVTYREIVKFPEVKSGAGNTESILKKGQIRTVQMTEEQFDRFIREQNAKIKIERKLKKKSMLKRLKRQNVDLRRSRQQTLKKEKDHRKLRRRR